MADASHVDCAIAYLVHYVDLDGRNIATAADTRPKALALIAEIEADGGRILERRVLRGVEADAILRAVRAEAAAAPEVF